MMVTMMMMACSDEEEVVSFFLCRLSPLKQMSNPSKKGGRNMSLVWMLLAAAVKSHASSSSSFYRYCISIKRQSKRSATAFLSLSIHHHLFVEVVVRIFHFPYQIQNTNLKKNEVSFSNFLKKINSDDDRKKQNLTFELFWDIQNSIHYMMCVIFEYPWWNWNGGREL